MTTYRCTVCGITGRATSQAVIDGLHEVAAQKCGGRMVPVASRRVAAPEETPE